MRAPSSPASRRTAALVVLLAVPGALLAAASALLLVLPRYRYSREALAAEAVLGVALLVTWHRAGRRPRRRWSRVALAALAAAFAVSLLAGASTALDALGYWERRSITDLGPSLSKCGPLGLGASTWNRHALAAVAAAFPDYQVRIVRGCRKFDDYPGREVRLRIGRFTAPGRATELVVGETVAFDGDPEHPRLSPYADQAAAEADLPRLDATPAVRAHLGEGPRLCLLDGGYGGFTLGWWLDCAPLATLAGPVPRVPGGWPAPAFARGCDGSELHTSPCFQAQVARPRPAEASRRLDGHRSLKTFTAHPESGG